MQNAPATTFFMTLVFAMAISVTPAFAAGRSNPIADTRSQATTHQARGATTPARGTAPTSDELRELQEREQASSELENFEGGAVVVIGSGVLLIALLVVLIVLLVD